MQAQQTENVATPETNMISEIFSQNQGVSASNDVVSDETEKAQELDNPEVKEAEGKALEKAQDSTIDKPKQSQPSPDIEKSQKELERIKNDLSETRRWGRINAQKVKLFEKSVKSMLDSGSLTDSEAQELLNIAKSDKQDYDFEEAEEKPKKNQELSPIAELIQLADTKLEDLAEFYEDDKNFNNKINSFTKFILHASESEVDSIIDELEPLRSNPMKLARKMYQIGEEFYNDIYKDADNAGGLKALVLKQKKEIENLRKKLDKSNNRNLQSQDYDKPTFRLSELNEGQEQNVLDKPMDFIMDAISTRDASRQK